jgi:hypothetical protein
LFLFDCEVARVLDESVEGEGEEDEGFGGGQYRDLCKLDDVAEADHLKGCGSVF